MMGRIGPGSGSIPTAHQTTLAITRNTNKAIKSCTIESPFYLLDLCIQLGYNVYTAMEVERMTVKPHTNFRLTAEAKALLRQMAKEQGISMTAVIETLVRQGAKKQGKENVI